MASTQQQQQGEAGLAGSSGETRTQDTADQSTAAASDGIKAVALSGAGEQLGPISARGGGQGAGMGGCTADYRFVYLGPAGSWTPLHADVLRSYSWSANVAGRKL